MTRNNNSNLSKRTYSPVRLKSTTEGSIDDNLINLPDLSGLRDDEKQHILNVLLRDENLRNKHLSRFMQLRKEVADLEQEPQSTSTSVCARCHAPFGFIFNTGDICPKCGSKVCKQCRLMYNVNDNDNGWLCSLCCKQMQLMSYSGEWIYSLRSNLRKNSVTASEVIRQSLTPSASVYNLNGISSSDTEIEDNTSPSSRRRPAQPRNHTKNKIDRMVRQGPSDEEKLDMIKESVKRRPYEGSPVQPSSGQTHKPPNSQNIPNGASSDDVDSTFDQSPNNTDRPSRSPSAIINMNTHNVFPVRNSSMRDSTDSLSTVHNGDLRDRMDNDKDRTDCASVTSSEWGVDDNKSERSVSLFHRHHVPTKRETKPKPKSSSNHNISGSIRSLHDAVRRIPIPHMSTSHTSLNSEKKPKSEISDAITIKEEEDTKSTDTSNKHNKYHSGPKILTTEASVDDQTEGPNIQYNGSSSTPMSDEPLKRTKSTSDSIQTAHTSNHHDNHQNPKNSGTFGSVGNLDANDSDDDIDGRFEKAKAGLPNRASSCMDIRGSRVSLNSALSETKARYGLDVSGTIELKLTYTLTTGALDIFINKCTNLAKAKRNHTSDPFVKVYLLPDRSKNSKRKTPTIKNTTDPNFENKIRYHVTKQEFETRVLWISVWSEATVGHNDFLGEIHIPLANCTLDKTEEYQLFAQAKKNELMPNIEPTMEPGEIQFQLTFIENPKNKEVGTLQVHYIQCKGIYHGKTDVDAICKGLLMPEKIKRKLPVLRKGPSPKWEVPLRWDGVRLDNLKNTSLEISIWCQERFRKIMLGFVRLNLSQGHFDNKPVPWLDATKGEKAQWEAFIRKPTQIHRFTLALRPATVQTK